MAKNEVLFGNYENFAEELSRAFGVLTSSVVRDFKCGLELCCLQEQNKIIKQFPRTSKQTIRATKDKDSSKIEQILREFWFLQRFINQVLFDHQKIIEKNFEELLEFYNCL